ncbi:MAG: C40 family peptidase [Alphaproteobacteria bacterium]
MEDRIVQAARGWLGTRFCHQGRVKKTASHAGGVDCLGLLIGVAAELQLCNHEGKPLMGYDERDYPHYPDVERLRHMLGSHLLPIHHAGIQPGDVVLLNIDGHPQHMGICCRLNGALSLIHAYAPARAVVEHHLDSWWNARIVSVFRIHPK